MLLFKPNIFNHLRPIKNQQNHREGSIRMSYLREEELTSPGVTTKNSWISESKLYRCNFITAKNE